MIGLHDLVNDGDVLAAEEENVAVVVWVAVDLRHTVRILTQKDDLRQAEISRMNWWAARDSNPEARKFEFRR